MVQVGISQLGMRSAEPEKPIFNMEYSEYLKAELARLQTMVWL